MNRFENAEKFLKEHAKMEISTSLIYEDLMKYGLPRRNYIEYIDTLAFIPYKNLKLDLNSDYLSINSRNSKNKHVKLYLGLDEDADYRSLRKIIRYLDDNEIDTTSKLYTKARTDAFVIRIDDISSAVNLIDYINANFSKEEGFILPNSFVYTTGIVGVTYDDALSYNYILSDIMAEYLESRKNDKKLEQVSLNNFNKYITDKISKYELLLMTDDKQQLEEDSLYQNNRNRFSNVSTCIGNIIEILNILSISLDDTKGLDDILEEIKKYQCKEQAKMPKNEVIDLYVNTSIEKYGTSLAAKYLSAFVTSNNYKYITEDSGCRGLFIENISPEDVLEITNGNIEKYYKSHSENNNKKK